MAASREKFQAICPRCGEFFEPRQVGTRAEPRTIYSCRCHGKGPESPVMKAINGMTRTELVTFVMSLVRTEFFDTKRALQLFPIEYKQGAAYKELAEIEKRLEKATREYERTESSRAVAERYACWADREEVMEKLDKLHREYMAAFDSRSPMEEEPSPEEAREAMGHVE